MSILYNDTSYLTFNLLLSPRQLEQFKEILARGLNTAPPEKYPDWIALADQLRAQEESSAFSP